MGNISTVKVGGTTYNIQDSSGTYLPLAGGTMTGVLTAKGSMYEDAYNGALNMNNSDIYGLNSIYTADTSDTASEGIHFYRDSTHVDTLWMNSGDLLFVPNRTIGTGTTKANSNVVLHSGNYTSYAAASSHTHSYLPLSGGTLTGSVTFNKAADTGLLLNKYNNTNYNLIRNHNNGNISISASSVGLYLGYENTTLINFLNGKASIDSSGNFNTAGTIKQNGTAVSLNGHTHSYLPLSGGTMTGTIISTANAESTALRVASPNTDSNIWRVYSSDQTYADKGVYGFNLKYIGTGSGDGNLLRLYADNQNASSQNIVWSVTQAGVTTFSQAVNIAGTLTLTKTTDAAGTANNSPALIVGGAATAQHLELDANEIMSKASGTTTGDLYLNNDGGTVYVNGVSVRNGSIINAGTISWDRLPTARIYDANVSRTANTVLAAPNGSAGTASFRSLVAADLPVVTAAKGGTGKTSLQDSCNALINGLSTGSSIPVDADYYVSQYVNGGTSTTTYHRRPMSALFSYINGKMGNGVFVGSSSSTPPSYASIWVQP